MTTGKQVTPMQQVCQGLQKMETNFKQSLPAGLSAERFIRTATNAIQMHPQKDKLLNANRQSLYNSCQKAAIDGLMLDGREAALVVFGTDATYMPMTQGLVKLARNSGEIANIVAEVVYSNDKFTYRIGLDEMPLHEPDWFGDRGEPIGVWAMVKLKNGEIISRLLPKEKIMKIAGKSKNGYQYDPVKGPYFDEWWRKTAIKNVLKYAPKSTELEQAIARGDNEEFDHGEMVEINQEQPAAEKKPRQTKAAQAVKEKSADSEPEQPEEDQNEVIDIEPEAETPKEEPQQDAEEEEEIPV